MIAPWRTLRRPILGIARTLLRGFARSNTANPVLPESSRRCAQEGSEFHRQFPSEHQICSPRLVGNQDFREAWLRWFLERLRLRQGNAPKAKMDSLRTYDLPAWSPYSQS